MNFLCVRALVMGVLAWPTLASALTLDEALRLAQNNAPSLTAESSKLQAATQAAIPAGELPDPKLVVGLQNFPVGGPNRGTLYGDDMTEQMIGIQQQVPSRDKRKARVELASASVDTAAAEGRIERLNVRQATAQAWIRAYAVERKEALFKDFYQQNRLLQDTVRAQLAGGRGQPSDVVIPKQEASDLAEREDELIQQRVQARAALKRWIGPAASEAPSGQLPNWKIDTTGFTHNLHQHPVLQAFAPRTREAEARLNEAKAQKTSDWSWEVDYQHRGREYGDMVSLQFTFDLPIFPGRRQNPGIAAKQAELDQLDAEREAKTREHTQELEDDLANYQRLDRAVQRSQDSLVPLAEEKLSLSLAGYRAGKGDLMSVVSARREWVEARFKQIDAIEQRALTGAQLYFAYGEPANE
ncbi:CzcC family heavy metal RND efflux outer membrane protein [Pseudomonas sp. Ag1]|jgi:cobalt-zinc-cadmium efflux system outer membrane protein|uniref:TolC family protein n=1 Tax=Pseudomonas sp. Ag1 TaxID=1197727 RepID=UPI000272C9F9|nr:TolC family protein [Pseudomonas sp. Ag1]EJF70317.1 CzcC family heavy metal RND efflux outer membrane protein [Pseudomonas sp. Ag1]